MRSVGVGQSQSDRAVRQQLMNASDRDSAMTEIEAFRSALTVPIICRGFPGLLISTQGVNSI